MITTVVLSIMVGWVIGYVNIRLFYHRGLRDRDDVWYCLSLGAIISAFGLIYGAMA